MVRLLRRSFTEGEAGAVARWRHPPPYDVYDSDPARPGLFLGRTRDGEGYYPAVDDDGAVVAYAVFGVEARVRGQEPAPGTVDVGLGMRADLTGHGLGARLLEDAAVLAVDLFGPADLRAAVAVFNARSLALCSRAGFRPVRDFAGPGGRPFRELVRPPRPPN